MNTSLMSLQNDTHTLTPMGKLGTWKWNTSIGAQVTHLFSINKAKTSKTPQRTEDEVSPWNDTLKRFYLNVAGQSSFSEVNGCPEAAKRVDQNTIKQGINNVPACFSHPLCVL